MSWAPAPGRLWLASACILGFGLDTWAQDWIPNEGQWDAPVQMRADWAGGITWLEDQGMAVWVAGEGYDELWAHGYDRTGALDPSDPDATVHSHAWRIHWESSQPHPTRQSLTEAGHKVNYYLGNDPNRWAEGLVPSTRFKLLDVWPGIDLRVGPRSPGDRADLPGPGWKEDWIVQPGADLAALSVRHEGVDLTLQPDGSIAFQLGTTAEARWGKPYAYQDIDGSLREVEVAYVVEGATVSFAVGDHDPGHPLVIDPDIVFATYIGATQSNWGFTAAYDDEARALGGTALWNGNLEEYPTTAGAISTGMTFASGPFDCGFSVFSADGTALEYSTVFGGGALDVPSSIVSDSQGAIYILGTTGSDDFPTTDGAFDTSYDDGPLVSIWTAVATTLAAVDWSMGRACL